MHISTKGEIKFQHPKREVKEQKQETNLIERKQYHQKDLDCDN